MALEWGAMGVAVAAELVLLLLITLPGSQRVRKVLISMSRSTLLPMLAIVPFALFLLLDIYWKYEHMPKCDGPACTTHELDRHYKSGLKSQRNLLLVVSALVFYWLLFRVTFLLVWIDQLNVQVERLNLQVKQLKDSEKPTE
eukprot:Gb_34878 [translate_table: standard]